MKRLLILLLLFSGCFNGYVYQFTINGIEFYSINDRSEEIISYNVEMAETMFSHTTPLSYYETKSFFKGTRVFISAEPEWGDPYPAVGQTDLLSQIKDNLFCDSLLHEMYHVYQIKIGDWTTMTHYKWDEKGWVKPDWDYTFHHKNCADETDLKIVHQIKVLSTP